jgi:hypothetical protein
MLAVISVMLENYRNNEIILATAQGIFVRPTGLVS